MQYVVADGVKIPSIGLGTWELRGRTCARIVEQAVKLGYRHFDTAQIYENEREVGDGIRASGIKRDEMFLTTKVWTTHFAPNELERSARESLVKLRMPYVDLLLLHWPNPHVPLAETLGALANAKQMGLARHIGVSNFTVALIEEAVAACPEPLACDQVEYHPYLDQAKVKEACAQHHLALVAYIVRSPRAGSKTTARWRGLPNVTARARRRSACAGLSSRMSVRSRAPRGSSGCRRTLLFSIFPSMTRT